MEGRVQTFIRHLAERGRVLVLGGHAVIQHGLNRDTIDTDIWLEPGSTAEEWSNAEPEHLESLTRQVIVQAEAMFKDWPLAA